MHPARWFSILLLASLVASGNLPLSAQTEANSGTLPRYSSESRLVLVPVAVTGKDGMHVGGLKSEAFKVEENGKPRQITLFEEVRPGSTPTPPADSGITLEGRSNFSFADAGGYRMTILVLDMLNTPFLYQGEGKRKLFDALAASLPPNQMTVIYGLGMHGLRELYPPTTDTAAVSAALRRSAEGAKEAGALPPVEARFQSEMDKMAQPLAGATGREGFFLNSKWLTLTALEQIAQAYAENPSRKILVWATSGFPFVGPNSPGTSTSSIMSKYEDTWSELASANITIYALDVSGLAGFNGSLTRYSTVGHSEQTLRSFSDQTGGQACLDPGSVEKCIPRVLADASSYYLLGYYLPNDDRKSGWRKLKVKVEEKGVHVRARDGFTVAGPRDNSPQAVSRQMETVIVSPVLYHDVSFNVREAAPAPGTVPAVQTGKIHRQFGVGVMGKSVSVDTQNGNAIDLLMVAVAFNDKDNNCGQTERHLTTRLQPEMLEKFRQTGVEMNTALDLPPGHYTLKFAVRDNQSGKVGSVEYPLDVR